MSRNALALAIGMRGSSLGNIESGNVRQPTPAHLAGIAKVLDLDFAKLMALAGHPFPGETTAAPSDDTFADLSEEERNGLLEYLEFLRWSGRSAPRD
jgi:transcriptional regulator with XRE-family HTH domain